nr:hypothetical protein GCM10020092_092630 [Actinoplanes digitatis]
MRKSPSRAVREVSAADGRRGKVMRTSVPAAIAALVLALPVVLIEESPSLAAATVFVETNPSTVPARRPDRNPREL